jgi:hypothetical protein
MDCQWTTNTIPGACGRRNFLPRLKILVTTLSDGYYYKVVQSRSRNELKENILRTTWIPYLNRQGFRMPTTTERDEKGNNQLVYLDGAFSRTLHHKCEAECNLPIMWETLFHSFSQACLVNRYNVYGEKEGIMSIPFLPSLGRLRRWWEKKYSDGCSCLSPSRQRHHSCSIEFQWKRPRRWPLPFTIVDKVQYRQGSWCRGAMRESEVCLRVYHHIARPSTPCSRSPYKCERSVQYYPTLKSDELFYIHVQPALL